MTIALCPGSFDPPTNGHIDVVERASRHFDQVIVAVLRNPAKTPLLDPEERVRLLEQCLAHVPHVEVESYEGLLVELAARREAGVIVKGLRTTSDTAFELQMATINASLLPTTDTLFIVSSPEWSFVSSSMVKEVARYGGDVGRFVPAPVAEALARHFATPAG
ncbi:MAG: pantetheine-phosphate adenylyltransferase [Actinomycetota bacterium]